ncbi:28259_t:CDS:2 [Dentiscutata erythropus]|uniref:28259_t:CDS:1 n=1 Tax=Dentiscutata erythropus TaxID=1348616 RepID=A0A9N8V7U3_9GLOM|nr:28259_t:CDS:2 [Dentiscutata erythropus]
MTKGIDESLTDSYLKTESDETVNYQYDKVHDTYAKSPEDDFNNYANYLMSNKDVEKKDKLKHYKEPVEPMNLTIEEKYISLMECQNLYHGLVFDMHGINLASLSASSFKKKQPKANLLVSVNFQAKLLISTNKETSFLLKNHIDPSTISQEDRIWLSDIYRISDSTKFYKLDNILNKWECYITPHDFDATYLISVDGETIMRNELDMWIAGWLKNSLDSLQVINWKELYPLYEIFDESLQKKIKSILGIDDIAKTFGVKEKVLITGVIPIEECAYQYRVKFPVNFKSNNYQIFGKLVKSDGEPISEAVIKFKSTNKYGFSANIENFEITEFMRLQINWILIGIPAEVGYFSTNTRDIDIIDFDSILITPITNGNNWVIILKTPEDLSSDSILFTSEIRVNVYDPGFTNRTNEENFGNENFGSKQELIQWCILIPPENQEFIKADIGSSFSINLRTMGQNINKSKSIIYD